MVNKYDTLDFKIVRLRNTNCGRILYKPEIYINSESLIEKIKAVESGFAKKGIISEKIAGDYVYLELSELLESLTDKLPYTWYNKVFILSCPCLELACHPVFVKIDDDGKKIRWSGFKNWGFDERSYKNIGKFIFERKDYYRKLRVLKKLYENSFYHREILYL